MRDVHRLYVNDYNWILDERESLVYWMIAVIAVIAVSRRLHQIDIHSMFFLIQINVKSMQRMHLSSLRKLTPLRATLQTVRDNNSINVFYILVI